MAQQEVIRNEYEGSSGALDVYDRKYLKYFTGAYTDKVSLDVFSALKTKDINVIEGCLRDLTNTTSNFLMYIGLICLVVERERLYEGTEYGVSYLYYTNHVLEGLGIPISTLSEAKIIVEQYVDHYKQLTKAGFRLSRNATKLLYLEEALRNHQENEVYNRIANDTFKNFYDWAKRKNIAHTHRPEPAIRVNVEIKGNKLFIDGKNILNFPRGTSKDIKEMVRSDLEKTMSIREGGNLPFIIDTYSKGEQTVIYNFLKQHRAKK
jgi:hypothetical protein